jgi:hypothetical protein
MRPAYDTVTNVFGGIFWAPIHRPSEDEVVIVTVGFGSTLRDVGLYFVPPERH